MSLSEQEATSHGGLNRLLQYIDKVVQDCDTEIARGKEEIEKYEMLKKRLEEMPRKLSYEILVPFGKVGYMPGRLINTNKVMLLLGDNLFAEVSCYHACKIIDRRMSFIQKTITDFESQKRLAESRTEFCSKLFRSDEEGVEIKEPFDEKSEKEWKEIRQRKRKPDTKEKRVVSDNEFEMMMKRLDELERQELEELEEKDEEFEQADRLLKENKSLTKVERIPNDTSDLDSDDLPSPPSSPVSKTSPSPEKTVNLSLNMEKKSVRFSEAEPYSIIPPHSVKLNEQNKPNPFQKKEVVQELKCSSETGLRSILRNNVERSSLNTHPFAVVQAEEPPCLTRSYQKAFNGIVYEKNFNVSNVAKGDISDKRNTELPKRISRFKQMREKSAL